MDIFNELKSGGNSSSQRVAEFVAGDPAKIRELVSAMGSDVKRVKNAAAKAVRMVSKDQPQELLPHFDTFRTMLTHNDSILKWIAMDVIGNLSSVASREKIDARLIHSLFDLLSDESIITASHAISALGTIADNHEQNRTEITLELAQVEKIDRDPECRDILLGKVIDSYRLYYPHASESSRKKMENFARRQQKNPRGATKKRAEWFIERVVDF